MKVLPKIIMAIVLIGFCFSASSQVKTISLPVHLEDTSEWYLTEIEYNDSRKFETKQISVDTTFDEMFRFEIGGQLIEITRFNEI